MYFTLYIHKIHCVLSNRFYAELTVINTAFTYLSVHITKFFFDAGDTAQCIMYGISFRFADLRTLFYCLQQYHLKQLESQLPPGKRLHPEKLLDLAKNRVRIPSKIYQLVHNYRSHNGILRLASVVIDALVQFFPESVDKLERDRGIIDFRLLIITFR